jgi:folate-dependent phosphoribosylglycinamide formyltransferase PurN
MSKILILGIEIDSTKIISNSLSRAEINHEVLVVKRLSFLKKLRLRVKKLGFLSVISQFLTMVVHAILFKFLKGNLKVQKILSEHNLHAEYSNLTKVSYLDNLVNSKEVQQFLVVSNPDIVILCGTDIVKQNILTCIKGHFINIHSGITPKYRGVHGGFWALVNNDFQNCGVTLHFVDKGVDTGKIIAQDLIQTNKAEDNLQSLAQKQLVKAIPLLINYLKDGSMGKVLYNGSISKQWYFPDLFSYLKLIITRRITF